MNTAKVREIVKKFLEDNNISYTQIRVGTKEFVNEEEHSIYAAIVVSVYGTTAPLSDINTRSLVNDLVVSYPDDDNDYPQIVLHFPRAK